MPIDVYSIESFCLFCSWLHRENQLKPTNDLVDLPLMKPDCFLLASRIQISTNKFMLVLLETYKQNCAKIS